MPIRSAKVPNIAISYARTLIKLQLNFNTEMVSSARFTLRDRLKSRATAEPEIERWKNPRKTAEEQSVTAFSKVRTSSSKAAGQRSIARSATFRIGEPVSKWKVPLEFLIHLISCSTR